MHLPMALRTRRFWALAAPAVAGALTAASLSAMPAPPVAAAAEGSAVNVTVNANENLGTIPSTAYGVNQAVWDSNMNTPTSVGLLSQAHVGMMRYPGGSYGDIYHFADNTAPGGFVAAGTNFDSFMSTANAVGAQPIIIANYGTGSPAEAADWVKYANVTKGYGAKYWEIGNEIYGDGYYGADWEADNHATKGPAAYAASVMDYASAMKAVDPSIKIGAVLTLPGNWPDSVVGGTDSGDWNHIVLADAGSAIDFVIVHWYPSGTGASTALNEPSTQFAGELQQLRQEINAYAGANASNIGIAVTETNSSVEEDTQTNGLFAADTYLTALENGAFTVDWWDMRNGAGNVSTSVDGATDFNDFGIISSGGCTGSVCEPALNTPFPAYFAISMLSKLGRPGDSMVKAGTDQPLVEVHAVHQANGNLAVMIENKDPVNSYPVNLHFTGFTPSSATPTVSTYGDEANSITTASTGTATSQTVAPYSLTTVVLTPQAGTGSAVSAPGRPAASNVTDTQATISWPAATGGSVTRYEVSRQFGTNNELLGESNSTSTTLSNLLPGTTYTVNVQATDQAGHLSLPSLPVTFTTGSPAHPACAVSYLVTQGWGSGFVTNVSITNTSSSDINGWTLTFTFPSSTESFQSGWNGNWTTDGNDVHVTNLDWDADLAPNGGNTVDIGFVGANNGAYPSPATFRVNGSVCSATYSN
jgi:cellulose binding protein with CBM2 domain/fibronectin type III domain protein